VAVDPLRLEGGARVGKVRAAVEADPVADTREQPRIVDLKVTRRTALHGEVLAVLEH
jgi:hypothetical protein